MSFLTGLLVLEAPAAALNNGGTAEGQRTDNIVVVKTITAKDGPYPYVSAQAFRYWLRTTLGEVEPDWKAAPVLRESKVAYTDANPLLWWDDELLGYMRAPGTSKQAEESREASQLTELEAKVTLTRCSPFRVGTLVAISPTPPTADFGTMSRHEGNPVPFEHQFYRAHLKGLFSLDLHACGTFSYKDRTGFKNLDSIRRKAAEEQGLEHLEAEKSYRLPLGDRTSRVATLLRGIGALEGGANQALHYTDVNPAFIIAAVTRGGNHPFLRCVQADAKGLPQLNMLSLREVVDVFHDQILSPLYVGWPQGYMDSSRQGFQEWVDEGASGLAVRVDHPRRICMAIAEDVCKPENAGWFS